MKPLSLKDSFSQCVSVCAETIKQGGIVCVPTDTVYGFICAAEQPEAAKRIATIKGRPEERPFALFVSSWDRLCQEAILSNPAAKCLANHFWPGALTLVVAAQYGCPSSQNGTVGARCPNTPFLQSLLIECGGLLINTSLNRSGEPPVCSLVGMDSILKEIDLVIDGGELPPSEPSTVIHCGVTPPRILREGAIFSEKIYEVLGKEQEG